MHERPKNTVFVLGAGFTCAFLPKSPLMVDDYGAEHLAAKFKGLEHASRVLDWERSQHSKGFIDIERFMTRLDSLMPYDYDQGSVDEFRLLLSALKSSFQDRLEGARSGALPNDDLSAFGRYCVENFVNCITFNYDDVLDQSLWEVARTDYKTDSPYWHPDGGYGFYCRPSFSTIADIGDRSIDMPPMLLLKLHGSVNWRPRRGYREPYVFDAITHHEDWIEFGNPLIPRDHFSLASIHLEPDPLIVPPVLSKSGLVSQPVLRLVWSRAYDLLVQAHSVTFLGYSFPMTDIAAQTLFEEALEDVPSSDVHVVNLASDETEKTSAVKRYQSVLGDIPEDQFDFRGVLEWSRDLAQGVIEV